METRHWSHFKYRAQSRQADGWGDDFSSASRTSSVWRWREGGGGDRRFDPVQRNIKPLVAFKNYLRPLWKPASQHGLRTSFLSWVVLKRHSSGCHRALLIRIDVWLWCCVQWLTNSTTAFPDSSLLSIDINVYDWNAPKPTSPVNSESHLLLSRSPEPLQWSKQRTQMMLLYLVLFCFCLMFTVYGTVFHVKILHIHIPHQYGVTKKECFTFVGRKVEYELQTQLSRPSMECFGQSWVCSWYQCKGFYWCKELHLTQKTNCSVNDKCFPLW